VPEDQPPRGEQPPGRDRPPQRRHPRDEERYEPMGGLLGLPGHIARELSPRARRIALAGFGVLLVGGALATAILIPEIGESSDEERARQAAEAAERRDERVRRLRQEQRVMRASGPADDRDASARERLRRRRALLADLRGSIEADARARTDSGELDGEIRRVRCGEFPRRAHPRRPEDELSVPRARYDCLAVTADIAESGTSGGGFIGHPFRALVDFARGRYAWCKISGRAGEGGLVRPSVVGVPRECGGSGDPPASG
jgi:hypothetical protein